ncbi:MAG TPA: hypothetical protein PK095_02975 [Myxococcota bacterium]|nr:hypothetical protein [Myxococcota bacterium]
MGARREHEVSDLAPRDAAIVLVVTALIVGLIVVFLGLSPSFAGESKLAGEHQDTTFPTTPTFPEELENASRK